MGGQGEHSNAICRFFLRAGDGDVFVLRAQGEDGYSKYISNQFGVTANSVDTIVMHNARVANYASIHDKSNYVHFIRPNREVSNFTPEICEPSKPQLWHHNRNAAGVLKERGTKYEVNSIDLTDWTTDIGGSWGCWSVSDGTFSENPSEQKNCFINFACLLFSGSLVVYPYPANDFLTVLKVHQIFS